MQRITETSGREAYVERLQKKIDKWNTELTVLEEKARRHGFEVETAFKAKAEAFRKKRRKLQSQLTRAEKTGDVHRDRLAAGVEKAWAELQGVYEEAEIELN